MLSNWKAVRQFALEKAPQIRHHTFERVSRKDFQPKLEIMMQNYIESYIAALPSKGKTIK